MALPFSVTLCGLALLRRRVESVICRSTALSLPFRLSVEPLLSERFFFTVRLCGLGSLRLTFESTSVRLAALILPLMVALELVSVALPFSVTLCGLALLRRRVESVICRSTALSLPFRLSEASSFSKALPLRVTAAALAASVLTEPPSSVRD